MKSTAQVVGGSLVTQERSETAKEANIDSSEPRSRVQVAAAAALNGAADCWQDSKVRGRGWARLRALAGTNRRHWRRPVREPAAHALADDHVRLVRASLPAHREQGVAGKLSRHQIAGRQYTRAILANDALASQPEATQPSCSIAPTSSVDGASRAPKLITNVSVESIDRSSGSSSCCCSTSSHFYLCNPLDQSSNQESPVAPVQPQVSNITCTSNCQIRAAAIATATIARPTSTTTDYVSLSTISAAPSPPPTSASSPPSPSYSSFSCLADHAGSQQSTSPAPPPHSAPTPPLTPVLGLKPTIKPKDPAKLELNNCANQLSHQCVSEIPAMDSALPPNLLDCDHFHLSNHEQAPHLTKVTTNHQQYCQPTTRYPNNTLITDLAEQHQNIAQFWCRYRYWRLLRGHQARARQRAPVQQLAQASPGDKLKFVHQQQRRLRSRLNFPVPEPLMRANVKVM